MSQRSSSFSAPWTCPNCNRRFAKKNQTHSCRSVSIDAHFKDKPAELKMLFDDLCAKLQKFGPLRADAVKSSINLISTHHFGAVKVQKDGLRIGFILARPVRHPRIRGPESITSTIYAHHVKITRKEDLDPELLAWLREAYTRSASLHTPPNSTRP